jgi:hypothetical protein
MKKTISSLLTLIACAAVGVGSRVGSVPVQRGGLRERRDRRGSSEK